MTTLAARTIDRRALAPAVDWLAVAVAVSLPWSTSATGIFIALWLVTLPATLDIAAIQRELRTFAGGLPVLLWVLAALGLLWADATWTERLGGLGGFNRLLLIPLLLAHFRQSAHGMRVLLGFFASALVLLMLSWALIFVPGFPWHERDFGVPIKDYIFQSEEFLICAFVLLELAFDHGRRRGWPAVAWCAALAVVFLANIAFVATGRTTLMVIPVLVLLLGWRLFRWQGVWVAAVIGGILAGALFLGSPYLRAKLNTSATELQAYWTSGAPNSTGLHLEFLKKSLTFIETAPIVGHGTGSIPEQFRATVGASGAASVAADNPHNQIFAVAIQLGLIGAAVLVAMWVAHVMLFRGGGPIAWIGTVIVVENIVSSLVNSHLFDFAQGWLYVFGVGVAGGMVLRERDGARASRAAVES